MAEPPMNADTLETAQCPHCRRPYPLVLGRTHHDEEPYPIAVQPIFVRVARPLANIYGPNMELVSTRVDHAMRHCIWTVEVVPVLHAELCEAQWWRERGRRPDVLLDLMTAQLLAARQNQVEPGVPS